MKEAYYVSMMIALRSKQEQYLVPVLLKNKGLVVVSH